MSSIEKLKVRLKNTPNDFRFDEAETLLKHLGYKKFNKGKTSGSRVRFYRESDGAIIDLHKPHPSPIMNKYTIRDLIAALTERGDL